ncbi:MAG: PorT family protein [Cyclobacteriaceae bacterium]|nr:PorT family protein [Cyclobacteriaceae bacterium]
MKRFYLLILCTLLALGSQAQAKKKRPSSYNKQNNENDRFLEKQWWLGFKAGVNLSDPVVVKTYSIIKPTNYERSMVNKDYEHYKKIGSQATVEVTFTYKGASFSFQPTYRHVRFQYSNHYEWSDVDNATNRLILDLYQEQQVDYLDFPILIKYDLTKTKLRPYLQVGGYSSILLNAVKSVERSGTDYASGGENEFKDEPITVGATDLFAKNHWGLIGGAGVNYNLGNVRVNLDIMYRLGMSNVTSTENRYGSDRLSGVGDSMDDLKLNTLTISLGCLFPMRFLSSGFKSLDK